MFPWRYCIVLFVSVANRQGRMQHKSGITMWSTIAIAFGTPSITSTEPVSPHGIKRQRTPQVPRCNDALVQYPGNSGHRHCSLISSRARQTPKYCAQLSVAQPHYPKMRVASQRLRRLQKRPHRTHFVVIHVSDARRFAPTCRKCSRDHCLAFEAETQMTAVKDKSIAQHAGSMPSTRRLSGLSQIGRSGFFRNERNLPRQEF